MLNEIEKGQLASATVQCFSEAGGSLENLPKLLRKCISEKVWKKRSHHGRIIELPNLRALITRAPIEGWGEDPKKIEALIKDDPEALAEFRHEMLGQEGGNKKSGITVDIINSDVRSDGTSRSYSLARVKKDCPTEVWDAVVAGELSAHRALVEAGIRKPTMTIRPTVEGFTKAIKKRLTPEQIRELVQNLSGD